MTSQQSALKKPLFLLSVPFLPQWIHLSIFIPIPKKGNAKECSNYCPITLISHTSKVMLKILQTRPQQYMTTNFQMFKLVLEKVEEPEIKLPTYVGSSKRTRNSRKTSTSALLPMPKPLTVWITINCGKFFKRWLLPLLSHFSRVQLCVTP